MEGRKPHSPLTIWIPRHEITSDILVTLRLFPPDALILISMSFE